MFLTAAALRDDPIPDFWVVTEPLVWEDGVFGRLIVPVGFRSDLASYPRMLRGLPCFDVDGPSREGALAHDWLYAWREWGKDKSDLFLRAALLSKDVGPACAWATYQGVHLFGASSWSGDAGALETRDFDTPDHYLAWFHSTMRPTGR